MYVDGVGAKGVDRTALTLGMNYAFNLSTVFKVEYRYDWASGPIFLDTKSSTVKKNNQLLSTAVVVSF
jgi:predicted porin